MHDDNKSAQGQFLFWNECKYAFWLVKGANAMTGDTKITMSATSNDELEQVFSMVPPGPLRVFGYGSLMWRPGFDYEGCCEAVLPGYRRSLCVWSWHHRGTQTVPGLVFGLDQIAGTFCQGCVYTIPASERRVPH